MPRCRQDVSKKQIPASSVQRQQPHQEMSYILCCMQLTQGGPSSKGIAVTAQSTQQMQSIQQMQSQSTKVRI